MGGKQVASKWSKTAALLSDPRIARHIPPTRMFNKANLRKMLAVHGMVVIKPVKGGGGHGVIKVSRQGGGYSYTYYSNRKNFASFDSLFGSLARLQKGRAYIIQKGIHLLTVNGRPIDYRVKYVKNGAAWEFRSMVGRLAKPGLFVTNLCRGGTQMTAAEGIRRSMSLSKVRAKKQEMRNLTRISTQVLESRYPGIGQLGYDYGIDRSGKIWIFEVNTRPQ